MEMTTITGISTATGHESPRPKRKFQLRVNLGDCILDTIGSGNDGNQSICESMSDASSSISLHEDTRSRTSDIKDGLHQLSQSQDSQHDPSKLCISPGIHKTQITDYFDENETYMKENKSSTRSNKISENYNNGEEGYIDHQSLGGTHMSCLSIIQGRKNSLREELNFELKTTKSPEQPLYICFLCNEEFLLETSRNFHFTSNHLARTSFHCSECGRSFTSIYYFCHHNERHKNPQPLSTEEIQLEMLQDIEYPQNVFKDLSKLLPVALPENPVLDSIQVSSNAIKQEMIYSYQCDRCPEKFIEKSSFTDHYVHHTGIYPYPCFLCTKQFLYPSALETHLNTLHETCNRMDFKCPKCPERLTSRKAFYEHQHDHQDGKIKTYFCGVKDCSKVFWRKYDLKEHEVMLHGSSSTAKFPCTRCPREFTTKVMLKQHSYSHGGVFPFHCPECNKGWATEMQMLKHKVYHEMHYRCEKCHLKFKYQKSMDQHKKRASCIQVKERKKATPLKGPSVDMKEEKQVCCQCKQLFKNKRSLHSHQKTVHQTQHYACSMCSKIYRTLKSLEQCQSRHLKSQLKAQRKRIKNLKVKQSIREEHCQKLGIKCHVVEIQK